MANRRSGHRHWRLTLQPVVERRCVGVEQEFTVRDRGKQVDFRALLPALAGHIRQLDPGDPRARRLPSGLALTADGWEAELVTPPVAAGAAAYEQLADLLARGRQELQEELTTRLGEPSLVGFSTHMNVSVPDDMAVSVGWEFARRCAPAVMSITERPDSPGMLVRPRRGRLEICSEFVDGERLVHALEVVVACVTGLLAGDKPPLVVTEPAPAREKFGWFVERRRAGGDLRDWVTRYPERCSAAPMTVSQAHPRIVDGVQAETVWLTWDIVAWSLTDAESGGVAFAVLRAQQEVDFLRAFDAGELTAQIKRALRPRFPRRRLLVHADIDPAALWHEMRPGALVPAERRKDGSVPRVSRVAALASHRMECADGQS